MHSEHTILSKRQLSEEVYRMEILAPLVAKERKAGQFVIVQYDQKYSERIPLTIADADPIKGSVTLIFQTVGASTHKLANKNVGDSIVLLGPLGNPTHIEKYGWAVCVGGGIGLAPLHPIVKALKEAGNRVTVISGARTKELLIMQEEMEALSDEHIVVTDDGSAGRKALVTEPLKELCSQNPKPDIVVTIGPPIMMKFCSATTQPFGVKTLASLNTIMIDGTGMCGGCRVNVGGKTKFVCVDGPEFDAHEVDWNQMLTRLGAYKNLEKEAHDRCHMEMSIQELKSKQAAEEAKSNTSKAEGSAN
ncbi:MAG: sulfide/dihydroorotate dehydrogenase-like FAD/NAD-binding protein [Spirochaetia bacterium]|nr:sulfide/dihydroorotate dehydrogenase-like FAD/NAD-binding protein [Spirochaetales bacterium]MDX9784862.1 sulfide/dihydroorotate dehydrogenase-like FAD/NAD-binding protein [Spirochaetia bacterium]